MAEQIERIKEMEGYLDEALEAVRDMEEALGKYTEALPHIKKLISYYTGPLWRKDFDDDSEGNIPKDLKRGVLSEDGVYNMLCDNRQILDEMSEILKTVGNI